MFKQVNMVKVVETEVVNSQHAPINGNYTTPLTTAYRDLAGEFPLLSPSL